MTDLSHLESVVEAAWEQRAEVSAAYPKWMWQTADHVARVGYDACEADRPRVTPGAMNNVLAALGKTLTDAAQVGQWGAPQCRGQLAAPGLGPTRCGLHPRH